MIRFLQLTRKNLIRGFGICFLIFYGFVIIMLAVFAIIKNNVTEFLSLEAIYHGVVFSCGISVFIMVLAFLTECYEFSLQQKIFNRVPFSQFNQIGFVRMQIFQGSIWKLYKEVYHSKINDYHVIADLRGRKKITFTFLAKGGNSLAFSPGSHREVELELSNIGLVVTIPVDSFWTPTIEVIHNFLQTLAIKMNEHHYKPESTFKSYENKMKWEMFMRGLSAGS